MIEQCSTLSRSDVLLGLGWAALGIIVFVAVFELVFWWFWGRD